MRVRRAVFIVLLVGLLPGAVPAEPAAAVGATNVEFNVSGELPTFPCEGRCLTGFGGSGTGAGKASALIGGNLYDATFTLIGAGVSGHAYYTEPGVPFCPAIGVAANDPSEGQVTLSGGTGIIARTGSLHAVGTVSNVNFTFSYAYVRVGATPAIVITGGSLTVTYFIPGAGWGWFTSSIVAGAGSGVFVVDPVQAASRCLTEGSLPFAIIGDAVLATV